MLEQLMSEIRKGGSLEVNSLAQRLGTTPQLVAAMLEHLQRLGRLRDYVNCADSCGGCSLQDQCGSGPAVRLWQTGRLDRREP